MPYRFCAVVLAALIPASLLPAQEGVRDLTGEQNSKFLTPNQLDRWTFHGEKGETIIAHVVSQQFDPVLALGRADMKDDRPLGEVDDPGSESRLAIRLPNAGKYEIRVNAFKFQGGGNYTLRVQRFQAGAVKVGEPVVGTLNQDGKGYHYWTIAKGRLYVPQLLGGVSAAWTMLDAKGRELPNWSGTSVAETDGEGYMIVSGEPNQRYDLVLREARMHDLAEGRERLGALQQGEADVCSFSGKAGDFRLLEVQKTGDLHARLVFAPVDGNAERSLERDDRPEIEFLPVASRGGRLRFAAVLGRDGRYQLQLVAKSSASYQLSLRDPSVPMAIGDDVGGDLPVGGAVFYRFQAQPAQLLRMTLTSRKFVPQLRLYDARGTLVADSSDDSDSPTAQITHMVARGGAYRLQVASLGDGGGGEFRQELTEAKVVRMQLGDRSQGTLAAGATDFRAFDGQEGRTVFLSVRSAAFEPTVSVRGPDGVLLASDNRGNAATGSLLAFKLPKSGRYVAWIASRSGAGEYTVRLIDGD